MTFKNRYEAGSILAKKLAKYQDKKPYIFGLLRGGLPVAYQVAVSLKSPLYPLIVQKIPSPWQKEYAIGAISKNILYLNEDLIKTSKISKDFLKAQIKEKRKEIKRKDQLIKHAYKRNSLKNQVVIIVDDGLATGISAFVAISEIQRQKPKQIIFATPVGAKDSIQMLKNLGSEVICLLYPSNLQSVGAYYDDFTQVSDDEVVALLQIEKLKRRVKLIK